MIAPQITNHVDAALARLIQQYRGLPRLASIITSLVDQIQDLEDGLFPIDADRQFFNGTTFPATNAQLDGIAELVGIQRNGKTDALLLVFIIGTIAENFSDTTMETMITILLNFFMPSVLITRDMYPAELNIEMAGIALDESLWASIFPILQKSVGAGIGVGFISTFDETDGFVMGDDNGNGVGLGFSNDDGAGNPTGPGGLFANDIYVNSGA